MLLSFGRRGHRLSGYALPSGSGAVHHPSRHRRCVRRSQSPAGGFAAIEDWTAKHGATWSAPSWLTSNPSATKSSTTDWTTHWFTPTGGRVKWCCGGLSRAAVVWWSTRYQHLHPWLPALAERSCSTIVVMNTYTTRPQWRFEIEARFDLDSKLLKLSLELLVSGYRFGVDLLVPPQYFLSVRFGRHAFCRHFRNTPSYVGMQGRKGVARAQGWLRIASAIRSTPAGPCPGSSSSTQGNCRTIQGMSCAGMRSRSPTATGIKRLL